MTEPTRPGLQLEKRTTQSKRRLRLDEAEVYRKSGAAVDFNSHQNVPQVIRARFKPQVGLPDGWLRGDAFQVAKLVLRPELPAESSRSVVWF